MERTKYVLILRDPIYFNEYPHSMHDSAKAAIEQAQREGRLFLRIDTYENYSARWRNDMEDARRKNGISTK